ncbi:MAG TPA: hypothetical protein VGG48_13075 [Rhizomicrobium sp.]|jgi:hypothetical protein
MSELDLINLGRSLTASELSWFTQVVTINFAMIVAIYYFLHQARLTMKLFAFFAYMVGSLLFFGEIVVETNIKLVVLTSLEALPRKSALTQEYIGLAHSWLADTTAILFTGSFWILWLGVLYLLFFWRRGEAA